MCGKAENAKKTGEAGKAKGKSEQTTRRPTRAERKTTKGMLK